MSEQKWVKVGIAEVIVDVYAGENCDKHRPAWEGSLYDEERDCLGAEIKLSALTFTPGTVIIIKEPVCPDCERCRSDCAGDGCEFDWHEWDEIRYS